MSLCVTPSFYSDETGEKATRRRNMTLVRTFADILFSILAAPGSVQYERRSSHFSSNYVKRAHPLPGDSDETLGQIKKSRIKDGNWPCPKPLIRRALVSRTHTRKLKMVKCWLTTSDGRSLKKNRTK